MRHAQLGAVHETLCAVSSSRLVNHLCTAFPPISARPAALHAPDAADKWAHQINMLVNNTLRDFAKAAAGGEGEAEGEAEGVAEEGEQ